jgi:hypothetical protein
MSILCTFPGRAGDLFWALPTIRALSRRVDAPIDLQICGEFGGLVPLLQRQPYLGYVRADLRWGMSEGWEAPPLDRAAYYDHIFHLGYHRWPELALPFETLHTFNGYKQDLIDPLLESELALQTPWIQVSGPYPPSEVVCGFSECHFELKVGLVTLLETALPGVPLLVLTHNAQTRWTRERPHGGYPLHGGPWLEEAGVIRNSSVFLGCNSGLHALAVALGIPVVMVEPMEARWNPIFFPLGTTGPQVTLVTGNDHQPTFDARHVADALRHALEGRTRV